MRAEGVEVPSPSGFQAGLFTPFIHPQSERGPARNVPSISQAQLVFADLVSQPAKREGVLA